MSRLVAASNADIDLVILMAAHRREGQRLEDTKQLGLQAKFEITDLINEKRSPVRLLEASDAAIGGAGERAANVPEQFAFNQGGGNGGAIDGDERTFSSRAVVVQGLRDQFLAGSAFTENQHRAVHRGGTLNLGENLLHLAGLSDDLVQPEFLVQTPAQGDRFPCPF